MTQVDEQIDKRDSMARALRALNAMEVKLQRLQDAQTEPIAIVGMGCRFPGGANNPDNFWELLNRGVNTARVVPTDRWDVDLYYDPDPSSSGKTYTRFGNFITDPSPSQFDPNFFNISTQEALSLDPQQRLLLEVTWEALEYGGIAADTLYESQTGVFIGMSTSDYQFLAFHNINKTNAYSSSGNAASTASGRLSYFLGIHGPTYTVDSACSSALVALHQACRSLRNNECQLAIVGGVNVVLSPIATIAFSKMGMLSPDGKCKAFSADADGYGRGEGCGILILQRLSDALKGHNLILALIRGSAVNHIGRSWGLSAPNSISQQEVIKTALAQCAISPDEISYIEAHGTGTPLADATEIEAIAAVFGDRDSSNPLRIGSVKTNIGHLEPASGMAAIIKTVLALNNERLPKHLNVTKLNPIIPWEDLPLRVVLEPEKWNIAPNPRLAGINSFSVSGTNVHVILEGAERVNTDQSATSTLPYQILSLSAKNKQTLQELCLAYITYLKEHPDKRLADVAYTTHTGRVHFQERMAIVAADRQNTLTALESYTQPNLDQTITPEPQYQHYRGTVTAGSIPQVAFLFTDQRSILDPGSGKEIYRAYRGYRDIIDEYESIFHPMTGYTLADLLCLSSECQPEAVPKLVDPDESVALHQAALFAIEIAWARLLLSWGVKPMMVMGSRQGLIAAAHIAGVMDFEDGLKLIWRHQENIESVIRNLLSQRQFHVPNLPVVNPITGTMMDDEILHPSSFAQLVNKPACFNTAIQGMFERGVRIFLSFGSVPPEINHALPAKTVEGMTWLSFWDAQHKNPQQMFEALGALYVLGVPVNWEVFYRLSQYRHRKLHLPTYPFQRQTYWFTTDDETVPAHKPTRTLTPQEETNHSIIPMLSPFDRSSFMHATIAEKQQQMQNIMRLLLAHILGCETDSVDFERTYKELGFSSLLSIKFMMSLQDYLDTPIRPGDFYRKENILESVSSLVNVVIEYEKDVAATKRLVHNTVNTTSVKPLIETSHEQDNPLALDAMYDPDVAIPDYVFLLSAPRAGSTLLRVMLDAHPAIYSPPELFLLLYKTMADFVKALTPLGWVDGLTRAVMHLKTMELLPAQDIVRTWVREEVTIDEIYRQLRSWAGRILVDKTPAYSYDLMSLRRIKSIPNTKVIFLSRHPYSSIDSMIRSRLVFNNTAALGLKQEWDNHRQAEQQWSTLNRNILDFCEEFDAEHWTHIRYEDLVSNPYQEMHRLCAFLNIPFDEATLHPYNGDHDTTALPDRRATGGDNNFNQYTEIDASKGEEWRFIQLPHHLGGIARSVASELGYSLPHEQAAGYPNHKLPQTRKPQKGRWHRIRKSIYERHQAYDHPQKSISGTFLRLFRKALRHIAPLLAYEDGLRVISLMAQSALLRRLYHKHLLPAWQVMEIITGESISASLRHLWTANYLNATLDWVLLKRQSITKNAGLLTINGITHLENALSMGKGVILVGHHCQPLRLWGDFVQYSVRALGISQTQVIGGLREMLPDPSLLEQGQSQVAQEILVQQLYSCLEVLTNGGVVYIDADGAQGSHPPITFDRWGRQVRFMTGYAELALQTSALIVPLTAAYDSSGRVHLKYYPALSIPGATLSHAQRIKAVITQYVDLLEIQWRRHPENIPLHICRNFLALEGTT